MEIRHFVNGGELFFAKKIDCIWRGDVDGEASKRRWNGRVQSNYRAFMYYRLNDVTKCIFVWQWTNVRSFVRSLARTYIVHFYRKNSFPFSTLEPNENVWDTIQIAHNQVIAFLESILFHQFSHRCTPFFCDVWYFNNNLTLKSHLVIFCDVFLYIWLKEIGSHPISWFNRLAWMAKIHQINALISIKT